MVELEGTEKQIIWAEKIRKEMVQGTEIIECLKEIYKENLTHPKMIAVLEELENFKNKVETEQNSSWFIDYKWYLTHYTTTDYKGEVVVLNIESIVQNPFIKLLMQDKKVKNLYLDKFYKR